MAKSKTEVPVHDREIQTGELASIVGKSGRWIRQLTRELREKREKLGNGEGNSKRVTGLLNKVLGKKEE